MAALARCGNRHAKKSGASDASATWLVERMLRRPATASTLSGLCSVTKPLGPSPTYEAQLRTMITALLVHPEFLRIEGEPSPGAKERELEPREFATRLSYFLWASCPDESPRKKRAKCNNFRLSKGGVQSSTECSPTPFIQPCRTISPPVACDRRTWAEDARPDAVSRASIRNCCTRCARNRAAVRQRAARTSNRANDHRRRLHIPQRTFGAALWNAGANIERHDACSSRPDPRRRRACACQRADCDIQSNSNISGQAWQVGSGFIAWMPCRPLHRLERRRFPTLSRTVAVTKACANCWNFTARMRVAQVATPVWMRLGLPSRRMTPSAAFANKLMAGRWKHEVNCPMEAC